MAPPRDSPETGRRPFWKRPVVIVGGVGSALAAGLGLAALLSGHDRGASEPPPASQGGLVVQTGRDDDIKLDERRPLRCFVDGKLVGELPLSDCARRNGVASGALDVGLDPTGALAAAHGADSPVTPLPPDGAADADAAPASAGATQVAAMAAASRVAGCWRYAEGEWRRLPEDLGLSACLQALYADRCEPAPASAYGRWADRTLRLVEGRLEISADNRNFRRLSDHAPGCAAGDPG